MILFSIAVPVYNVEQYLRPCLDSICGQLADDVEVLLVDDGSTDCSGAICDEYAGKNGRISVIHQPNRGVSAARNTLIRHARGKWLVFVDGDDVLTANALQIMRGYADRTDELIIFEIQRFFGEFHLNAPVSHPDERHLAGEEITGFRIAILDAAHQRASFSAWSLRSPVARMWRLAHIRNAGLQFPIGIQSGEDMLFNFSAARTMERICLVRQCVYGYRSNHASITRRFSEDASVLWDNTMKNLMDDMKSHMELQSEAMRDAFWNNAAYHFENALIIGIQHPDCTWNRTERLEQLRKLCAADWVRGAAEYAAGKNTITVPLRLALNQDYKKLDRYCRKKYWRYSLVRRLSRSQLGRRFVKSYSERKKKRIGMA